MNIRIGSIGDLNFAKEMLFEACFWDASAERPDFNKFFKIPEIYKILSDWGRAGDKLIIAENEQENIGAAWYRLWKEENQSYGFVDAKTPELGTGIRAKYRSKGIGRKLLQKLIDTARSEGFKALSLSVDLGNFARYLYESEGFKKVGESGTSWTYMLEIKSIK